MSLMSQEVWQQPSTITWTQILLNSFSQLLGYELISREGNLIEQAQALFFASFVVASHGTQTDPLLNYGNQAALQLWEMSWEELTQTPSRLTAEPINREERQIMLQQAAQQGYIDNYRGVRISSTGKRFLIKQAIIWNLSDSQGKFCGQAATFSDWSLTV
jgi:hypothetical protein